MAVLPASKSYPRGGAPRRTYTPGAPLFAKMAMKFLGVEYKRGSELPVERMSKHKHWELWTCGKADHLKRGPFDKPKAAVGASETAVGEKSQDGDASSVATDDESTAAVASEAAPDAVSESPTVDLSDDELERLTRPE